MAGKGITILNRWVIQEGVTKTTFKQTSQGNKKPHREPKEGCSRKEGATGIAKFLWWEWARCGQQTSRPVGLESDGKK